MFRRVTLSMRDTGVPCSLETPTPLRRPQGPRHRPTEGLREVHSLISEAPLHRGRGHVWDEVGQRVRQGSENEFFINNLLVRIHSIIEMIWWTGLAP